MDNLIVSGMTVLPILIFKMGILTVGYLTVKMGYQLFLKGITGEFKLKTNIEGFKADLISASPGTLFVFMGIAMIIFSILSKNPYHFEIGAGGSDGVMNIERQQDLNTVPDELKDLER